MSNNIANRLPRADILTLVKKCIANVKRVPVDSVKGDSNLETGLGCDSLDIVEIVMQIENAFGISVTVLRACGCNDEEDTVIRDGAGTVDEFVDGICAALHQQQV
jgi:acyl carrier protein